MDTAGQEKYNSLSAPYMKMPHGFIFVYDITNKESFNNIFEKWINIAYNNNSRSHINILVGNKSDLNEERKISTDDANKKVKGKDLIFFGASDKKQENVYNIFIYLTYKLAENFLEWKNNYDDYSEDYK